MLNRDSYERVVGMMVMTGATLDEVKPLLGAYHYLGARCANPIHVFACRRPGGLLGDTGEPVAAIVYASPVNRYFGQGAIEISRLVRRPDYDAPLSAFISWSLRWLKSNTKWLYCLAYADSGAGHHGGIYQASSFDFIRISAAKGWWENEGTGERCSLRAFDQRRDAYRKKGWIRRPGTPKFLYVKPIVEPRKKLLTRFGWSALACPKPDMTIETNAPRDIQ